MKHCEEISINSLPWCVTIGKIKLAALHRDWARLLCLPENIAVPTLRKKGLFEFSYLTLELLDIVNVMLY